MKQYYVYIMTNRSRTLYTGVTNNLEWHDLSADWSLDDSIFYQDR